MNVVSRGQADWVRRPQISVMNPGLTCCEVPAIMRIKGCSAGWKLTVMRTQDKGFWLYALVSLVCWLTNSKLQYTVRISLHMHGKDRNQEKNTARTISNDAVSSWWEALITVSFLETEIGLSLPPTNWLDPRERRLTKQLLSRQSPHSLITVSFLESEIGSPNQWAGPAPACGSFECFRRRSERSLRRYLVRAPHRHGSGPGGFQW